MAIHIWRDREGYQVMVAPPHARRAWTSIEPLDRPELARRLSRLGVHVQDQGEAFHEADEGRPAPTATQAAQAMADAAEWRRISARNGSWVVLCLGAAMVSACSALFLQFGWVMKDFGGIPWSWVFVRMNAGMLAGFAVGMIGGLTMIAVAVRRLQG